MEREDRDKILQNIEKLIQYTNYDKLMRQCIDRRLIFDVMQEQIEASTPDPKVRHKYLLEKITRRGPKAFSIFLSILKNTFPDAFDHFNHLDTVYGEISIFQQRYNVNNNHTNIINDPVETRREPIEQARSVPTSSTANASTANGSIANASTANGSTANALTVNGSTGNASTANRSTANGTRTEDVVGLKEFTLPLESRHNYTVQKSTKFHGLERGSKVSTYRMHSKNRGVLFLANIVHFEECDAKKRNGADADRDNLISLFREMGFKIFYYENLKRDEFIKLVDQLVVSSHLRATDCLVFGLLTHGERDYASFNVEFSDLQKMDVEDILSKFSNSNCDHMIGKPKIFIFPFCRGSIPDPGILGNRKVESDHVGAIVSKKIESINLPTYSDMKICYATVPGYRSFRDPENGSWYIQIMCKVWSEHAHDTHLDDLLKMVGNTASTKRTEESKLQTCSNEDRGFFKKLYFNPGFYVEEN